VAWERKRAVGKGKRKRKVGWAELGRKREKERAEV
jgi:hypothetical protein